MEQDIEESQVDKIKRWSWNQQPNWKSKRSTRLNGKGSDMKIRSKGLQTVEKRTDKTYIVEPDSKQH